ncbi:MAG: hypothetical protein AAF653_20305, partial [Chloroflexota bacterium]
MSKRKTKNETTAAQARDWVLIGLRMLYALTLGGYLYWQSRSGFYDQQAVFIAMGVGIAANLVLMIFVMVPSIHPQAGWAIIVGDWATIGAFTPLVYRDPLLVMALLTVVLAISVGRLGWQQGSIGAVGAVAVFVGVELYITGFTAIPQELT